jgi:hypothetical protein
MTMRLATLLILASTLGFAGSWSGLLVDAKCYASEQTNVNKDATTVDRDMNGEIRYCSPGARTKSFGVVLPDWDSLKFDSAGNAKAAQLIRSAGKRSVLDVTVTGTQKKDRIEVSSLSAAK